MPIPKAIESSTAQGCPTVPADEFDTLFKGMQLVGCGRWAANTELTMHFDSAEAGTQVGLMLFTPEQCANQLCRGEPVWQAPVEGSSSRTFHLGPVDPGAYILVDPVHPMTTAVAIDVS